jgi:hypothetical protein
MTPYQILGVPPGASLVDIKAAYRRRMMQCHPDKGGNEEEAKLVNRAFEMLTKPQPEPVVSPGWAPGVYVHVVYYGNFTSANTTTSTGYW